MGLVSVSLSSPILPGIYLWKYPAAELDVGAQNFWGNNAGIEAVHQHGVCEACALSELPTSKRRAPGLAWTEAPVDVPSPQDACAPCNRTCQAAPHRRG